MGRTEEVRTDLQPGLAGACADGSARVALAAGPGRGRARPGRNNGQPRL
jgi:hypothetical protein